MLYHLTETVIEYHPNDLEEWKHGDKQKLLAGRKVPPEIHNQPEYHFGENFVLKHYEQKGWNGFTFYSFDSTLEKYKEGKRKIEELFPKKSLDLFRDARLRSKYAPDSGLPDLFLYNDDGLVMFIEVKKQGDKASEVQFERLAQIRAILKAEIGIVYLVEKNHSHTPKTYKLDLDSYTRVQ